jgi:hypothetical protein
LPQKASEIEAEVPANFSTLTVSQPYLTSLKQLGLHIQSKTY